MQVINYLFCRQPRDTCAVKDGCVKAGAAGLGTAIGITAIYYAASSVRSTITQEKAQYCADQTLAMLAEVQRQLQLFNATCIPDSPGSTMSHCNITLLPKPVNTSCEDISVTANYLPTIFAVAAVATFGLFIGRTILTSIDQHNKQKQSTFFLAPERNFLNSSTEDSTTLSETYKRPYGSLSLSADARIKQNGNKSYSASPEEYSWHIFSDDGSNDDSGASHPTQGNDNL